MRGEKDGKGEGGGEIEKRREGKKGEGGKGEREVEIDGVLQQCRGSMLNVWLKREGSSEHTHSLGSQLVFFCFGP